MGEVSEMRLGPDRRIRSLSIGTVLLLGLGSLPAIADGLPGGMLGEAPPRWTSNSVATPTPSAFPAVATTPDAYTQAMLIGYEASKQKDYHTALINFRRALAERPGDYYAMRAIANMETYLDQQRREAARINRIEALQSVLGAAVTARDWACAAATVDELITLVPPNSLERGQLVTYRGEITVFLDSRSDVEQWSTVCPGK